MVASLSTFFQGTRISMFTKRIWLTVIVDPANVAGSCLLFEGKIHRLSWTTAELTYTVLCEASNSGSNHKRKVWCNATSPGMRIHIQHPRMDRFSRLETERSLSRKAFSKLLAAAVAKTTCRRCTSDKYVHIYIYACVYIACDLGSLYVMIFSLIISSWFLPPKKEESMILIRRLPKMVVPLVIIHSSLGFSIKKNTQLLGYPHLWKSPCGKPSPCCPQRLAMASGCPPPPPEMPGCRSSPRPPRRLRGSRSAPRCPPPSRPPRGTLESSRSEN